jgi:hypothetical protein
MTFNLKLMGNNRNKKAITKTLITTTIVAAILFGGILGMGVYSHALAQSSSNASTSPSSTADMEHPWSGGFLNGQVVTFVYTQNYTCQPDPDDFPAFGLSEQNSINAFTTCEVGGFKGNTALPVLYVLVPAFAGLSIFGVPKLGASSQGFPTFQSQTILTDCGAGGTKAACGDHPTYFYSPAFTTVEQYLGIKTGVFGLPEGVLPTPAHSHLVNESDSGAWNNVAVLVFDPNIFPNPVTGQCTQVVQSDQANPTANCLNNYAALQNALTAHDSAVQTANSAGGGNPIYNALGKPSTQVVVPGDLTVPQLANPNTNLVLYFNVYNYNPYPPFTNFGDLTSTASTPTP